MALVYVVSLPCAYEEWELQVRILSSLLNNKIMNLTLDSNNTFNIKGNYEVTIIKQSYLQQNSLGQT